jgi:DNA-binding NarL/FixJ family response regulator
MSELRILLVEDSAADAELAKLRLRSAGEVEHCATLAAALTRLADASRPRPSVVLLDLSLPDAHGLAALERIQRAQPPPVLVMSGDDDPASERAALERGALGFVRKGALSPDELLRTVREAAGAQDDS